MPTVDLDILTPEWAEPLLPHVQYKGAKGGRSGGKSHFFAELAVEEMVTDPGLRFVCIREVQRSLRFSVKSLVESKIKALGVSDLFDVMDKEIRRVGGPGIMIFEGMQDHTADSIKSLEGFGRAWFEEAQRMSARSLGLLVPTIRADGSEMWFSWNPEHPDDPVDKFFAELAADGQDDHVLVHVNYTDNPFCPEKSLNDARRSQRVDPDAYAHVWLGGYNVKSEVQVLSGKCRVDEFEPNAAWDGPYFGADWGFSQDPTAITRSYVGHGRLWIDQEDGGVGWDNDFTASRFKAVPGAKGHVIRADNSRPETINEMRKRGLDVVAAPKWSGSVEDGIQFLRSFEEIVIHERCTKTIEEARLWRYKTDRLTGDPLPQLQDGNDHHWDAVRYALSTLIKKREELPPLISQSYYTG